MQIAYTSFSDDIVSKSQSNKATTPVQHCD
uniref:Uncharacterized protein n=1 Tax=Anguilla anguilla TaxID=7936 RepID=A0A0E9XIZ5_ANGAN